MRYNPLDNDPLKKSLSWKNFKPKNSDSNGKITEKFLKNSTLQYVNAQKGTITVSLSSGIDSSLCLAILRELFPDKKIIAICGVFKHGYDESKTAKKIAKQFDAIFKTVNIDSVFTNMPELISLSKQPKWNSYHHLISKEARKFGNTLFIGDGADELFGGYVFRYNKFLTISRPSDNWKIKSINYLECHNRDWVPDQESMFGKAINFSWNTIISNFKPYFSNPLDSLTQVMLADFNGKLLHDFIPASHTISKHYQLKNAAIFLNDELIKFACSLPLEQKYSQEKQKGKLILRKIAKRYGIEHIDEKRGFSPSLLFDWNDRGKKVCESYLLNEKSYIYSKKLINFNWVIRSFEKVENDGDIRYLNRLISILALEVWYRIFITNELSSTQKLR